MLIDQSSGMLGTARGLASRLRQTARWGCAKLSAAPPLQTPGQRLPCPPVYSVWSAAGLHKQAQHGYTTCAALQTRESPLALDPGDYEAGQIQVSCSGVQFNIAALASSI